MERFIPMEIFQKKVTPLEVFPFSRHLTETNEIFFGPFICLTSARLPLEAEGD